MSNELRTKDLVECIQALTIELMPAAVFARRTGNLILNAMELLRRSQTIGLMAPKGTEAQLEHLYEEDYFKHRDDLTVKRG